MILIQNEYDKCISMHFIDILYALLSTLYSLLLLKPFTIILVLYLC
jgi:hypothetical protein